MVLMLRFETRSTKISFVYDMRKNSRTYKPSTILLTRQGSYYSPQWVGPTLIGPGSALVEYRCTKTAQLIATAGFSLNGRGVHIYLKNKKKKKKKI